MYPKSRQDRNYQSKELADIMNSEIISINVDHDLRKSKRVKNDIKDIRSYKQLDRIELDLESPRFS